jgi:hypothetical protein
MRITPCAALNDAFRARHFLLRPIIRFSTQWQALALAGGGGGGGTLLSIAHRRPLANRPRGTA